MFTALCRARDKWALLTFQSGSSKDPDPRDNLWMVSGGLMTVWLSLRSASAWNTIVLSSIQIVTMCLSFMEYGAIGRRQGTCLLSVALVDSSGIPPVHLPSLSRKRDNTASTTHVVTGLQIGPALSIQSQNSMGPVPRPSLLFLPHCPQPSNIHSSLEHVQIQQPPHSNLQSWASLIWGWGAGHSLSLKLLPERHQGLLQELKAKEL